MNPFGPVTGRCLLIGLTELKLCSLSTHQTPKGFVIARRPGCVLMFIGSVIKCYDLELFIRVIRPPIAFPLWFASRTTNSPVVAFNLFPAVNPSILASLVFFRLRDQWNHHSIRTYNHVAGPLGVALAIRGVPGRTNQTFITSLKRPLTFGLHYLSQPVGTDANLTQTLQVLCRLAKTAARYRHSTAQLTRSYRYAAVCNPQPPICLRICSFLPAPVNCPPDASRPVVRRLLS